MITNPNRLLPHKKSLRESISDACNAMCNIKNAVDTVTLVFNTFMYSYAKQCPRKKKKKLMKLIRDTTIKTKKTAEDIHSVAVYLKLLEIHTPYYI